VVVGVPSTDGEQESLCEWQELRDLVGKCLADVCHAGTFVEFQVDLVLTGEFTCVSKQLDGELHEITNWRFE